MANNFSPHPVDRLLFKRYGGLCVGTSRWSCSSSPSTVPGLVLIRPRPLMTSLWRHPCRNRVPAAVCPILRVSDADEKVSYRLEKGASDLFSILSS